MATIKAIQSGNWTDVSTWDSNTVPGLQDIADCDSYTVTINQTSVSCEKICNTGGGHFLYNTNSDFSLTSDIEAFAGMCLYIGLSVNNKTITIDGDVIAHNSQFPAINATENTKTVIVNGNTSGSVFTTGVNYNAGPTSYWIINGDVSLQNSDVLIRYPIDGTQFHYNVWYLTINGNVDARNTSMLVNIWSGNGNYGMYVDINGDVNFYNNAYLGLYRFYRPASDVWIMNMFGDVYCETDSLRYAENVYIENSQINFYGNLTVGDVFNSQKVNNINFYGDKITYLNRDRLFNIFTSAQTQLNTGIEITYGGTDEEYVDIYNHLYVIDHMPQEDDVKMNVTYGLRDEYRGRMELPQPANVLEGIEYGGYTGTLAPVQGTIVESGTVVNLTQDQINRIAESITAEMAQTMLQQYFG